MDKDTIASEMARMVEDWSGRGKHWDKRADELADQSTNFNMPLLEAADIQQGQTVLDCASGAGEPVLSITKIIGPDGHVTATDLVEIMMLAAKRRARAQGLDNIDFQAADMVQLPFEDNHFDRVVCRLGIMFVPNRNGQRARPCGCLNQVGKQLTLPGDHARTRRVFLLLPLLLARCLAKMIRCLILPHRFLLVAKGRLSKPCCVVV